MTCAVDPTRSLGVTLGATLVALSAFTTSAQCQQPDAARWAAIARGIGREGKVDDGYYRVEFPRRDLTVKIGEHTLAPAFELTSYFTFVPTSTGVMTMGEIVMRDDEVNAVMDEARMQGVEIPALHNHLIGENPRLAYAHVMTSGDPAQVARKLHALLTRTATPFGKARDEPKGDKSAWSAEAAALGEPEEAAATTAEWEYPRRDSITEGGIAVKSSGALETASEVVFQRLASDRAATTGELFLAESEITPVTRALEAGGIHVTAIHMHMVRETPRLYWLHWYAVGNPSALAKTVRSAIDRTNSVRSSKH